MWGIVGNCGGFLYKKRVEWWISFFVGGEVGGVWWIYGGDQQEKIGSKCVVNEVLLIRISCGVFIGNVARK